MYVAEKSLPPKSIPQEVFPKSANISDTSSFMSNRSKIDSPTSDIPVKQSNLSELSKSNFSNISEAQLLEF